MAGYMWSDDYAFLRGINALDVSARTKLLIHEGRKRLIWFYQGLSLLEGGLQKATDEILEMFPERLSHWHGDPFHKMSKAGLIEEAKALARCGRPRDYGRSIESITEFIQRLCTCPKLMFPNDANGSTEFEEERIRQAFPETRDTPLEVASIPYFKDIIGAMVDYKRQYEERALSTFYKTAIANKMWAAFDLARETGKIVVVNGREGRGKTVAAKAYCRAAHMDSTRFTSLDRGARSNTTAFRCLSDGIGVKCGYKRTIPEIQARTKDVLKRSHIMPVIDEAHYAFPQAAMMSQPPEFIDWLCTALFNEGVPVVLITTPQFIDKVAQASVQAGWNYRQFERRMEWVDLPESNTLDDIKGVAQSVFTNAKGSIIDEVVAYVKKSGRDLSAIGDLCDHLKSKGLAPSVAIRQQISEAIESVAPGIVAFRSALEQAVRRVPPRRARGNSAPIKQTPKPQSSDGEKTSRAVNGPLNGFESVRRDVAPALVDG